MANLLQGADSRLLVLGKQVIEAAATPPASAATANIATVTGGAVLITSFLGLVTTALSGATGAIALGTAPTVGTAETGGIGTAGVVGGAEIGTWIGAPAATTGEAGAVTANTHAGNVLYLSTGAQFVVSAGYITWTTSVLTMTGQVKWYLTYIPLDTGAYVT